jgi:hypothetical protein
MDATNSYQAALDATDEFQCALAQAFSRLGNEFKPVRHRLLELEQENERLQRELASSAEELVLAHADANRQIARREARQEVLLMLENHRSNYKSPGKIYIALTAIIEEFNNELRSLPWQPMGWFSQAPKPIDAT